MAKGKGYTRTCALTVLDDGDPGVTIGDDGVADAAKAALNLLATRYPFRTEGPAAFERVVKLIKAERTKSGYDTILGLSGGVDSSCMALLAKDVGLNPLVVHLDNGWNSELAVQNIERVLKYTGFDLHTHVIEWDEFRDFQRALFLSSTKNVEAVTDHAIYALMYREAARHGVRFILDGFNIVTESVAPAGWGRTSRDARFLKAIYRRYGSTPLRSFPWLTAPRFLYYMYVKGIRRIPLLNYTDFNYQQKLQELQDRIGWRPYARKHGESRFTRFYQEHYMPTKFGLDKRKIHYSSLIVAGQMTRDEALAEMNKPLYQPRELAEDMAFVRKKLGFSEAEFDAILSAEGVPDEAFPRNDWLFNPSASLTGRAIQWAWNNTAKRSPR